MGFLNFLKPKPKKDDAKRVVAPPKKQTANWLPT